MRDQFSRILARFGRGVELYRSDETQGRVGFALIQSLAEGGGRSSVPTPLGEVQGARFLYLGEAALSLEGMEGGRVLCDEVWYEVLNAQGVYLGRALSHWRGILCLREEEAL